MNILFLTMALLGADDRNRAGANNMPAADINGSWQVVYAECHGNPLTATQATPIVIRDNTIQFGPESLRYSDQNQIGSRGQPLPSTQPRQPIQPGQPAQAAVAGKAIEEKMAALQNLTKHNWRLEFGPEQSVKAHPVANRVGGQPAQIPQPGTNGSGPAAHQAMAKSGIYIATKDYLALCFHKSTNGSARDTDRAQQNSVQTGAGQRPTSGEFVVILRRQGAAGHLPGQVPGQVPAQNTSRAQ